jgi:toluene monooxygenase system ferredoxin subunit
MRLSQLVTNLNIEVKSGERWAILGPEARDFGSKLHPAELLKAVEPGIDGLLLVGALSAHPAPLAWLEQTISYVDDGARLVVIDWQYDGPPNPGPDLERRVRRGGLCRWLRQSGFGQVNVLSNQAIYYTIQAIKGAVRPGPHAGEFVVVAEVTELPKNRMKKVELFGHHLIVANTGQEIVAFAQACPHAGRPLDKGLLRGRNIVCRTHNYMWNVCSGEPIEPAGEDILPRYPVKIDLEQGQILVALAPLSD